MADVRDIVTNSHGFQGLPRTLQELLGVHLEGTDWPDRTESLSGVPRLFHGIVDSL